jgi:hypothetical protein
MIRGRGEFPVYNGGVNRWIAALASALLLAISCSRESRVADAANPASAAIDDSTPRDGGTLIRRGETDVSTLNPVLATSAYDRRIAMYLFTPLIALDINLRPMAGLADSWEISSDGKAYTFHLNPKATFSDRSPVLASDVLFTINKIIDPNMEATQIAGGFDQLDVANTRVVDPHTIVIAFKQALAPQIIQFSSLFPIPEHVYAKGDFRTDFTSAAVGSGPYRLVRRIPGKEVLMERREDYWGVKPHIQMVLFKTVSDLNTAWNAVKRGDIDETIITSDVWTMESQRAELQRTLDFRRFYTLTYNFVGWNLKDPMFADKRVRRAMAQCIDLKSIINNLYHGTARAMSGPFTPDEWAYNPSVPVIEFDPQAARRTLNSLGWLDTDVRVRPPHHRRPDRHRVRPALPGRRAGRRRQSQRRRARHHRILSAHVRRQLPGGLPLVGARSRSRPVHALSLLADAATRPELRRLREPGGRQADGGGEAHVRHLQAHPDLPEAARGAGRRSAVHLHRAGLEQVGHQQARAQREGEQGLGAVPLVSRRARLVARARRAPSRRGEPPGRTGCSEAVTGAKCTRTSRGVSSTRS